ASKTYLVAQREYLENIRTKTFWISIFIVPVLIAASIGIGILLNKFKEVQKYAVVDLGSSNLESKVERELRSGDALAMLKLLTDLQKSDLPPELLQIREQGEAGKPPTGEQQLTMLNWIMNQPPEDMAAYQGIGFSKRYQHVRLDHLDLAEHDPETQPKELSKLVKDGKLFAYFV